MIRSVSLLLFFVFLALVAVQGKENSQSSSAQQTTEVTSKDNKVDKEQKEKEEKEQKEKEEKEKKEKEEKEQKEKEEKEKKEKEEKEKREKTIAEQKTVEKEEKQNDKAAADPFGVVNSDGFRSLTATFESTTDVHLFVGSWDCSKEGEMDSGTWYFEVRNSNGQSLSTTNIEQRKLKVNDGVIDDFDSTEHLTGKGPCGKKTIKLAPFGTSSSPFTLALSKDKSFPADKTLTTTFNVQASTTTTGWLVSYWQSVQQSIALKPNKKFNSPTFQQFAQVIHFDQDTKVGDFDSYFASRHTAIYKATFTDSVTFKARHKDGCKLWINGKKVFDKWNVVANPETTEGVFSFTADATYHFVLEYFNGAGTPTLDLTWKRSSDDVETDLPAADFTPAFLPVGVQVEGVLFALLDNSHPEDDATSSQSTGFKLRGGYELATVTSANAAVLSYKWAADCLVVKGGAVFATDGTSKKCASVTLKTSVIGSEQFYSLTNLPNKNTYKILISQGAPQPEADFVEIKSTVVYNGYEFAVHDGSDKDDSPTEACPGAEEFRAINTADGWDICGKKSEATVVLSAHKFGADACALKDGSTIRTGTGSVSGFAGGIQKSGNTFRAKQLTNQCVRVLLCRETEKENTIVRPQITNYISHEDLDFDYATVDNSDPFAGEIKCQETALQVPEGWKLATRSSKFESFVARRRINFGAQCLTYADGTGFQVIQTKKNKDRVTSCGTVSLGNVKPAVENTPSKRNNVPGAIWTGKADGDTVNGNKYDSKEDVYLIGGPLKCRNNGLDDGDYYFMVTDPSGSVLLSNDDIENRRVTVTKGRISAYSGTHQTGVSPCEEAISVALYPYLDTPNKGGEYKTWITPVEKYDVESGRSSFGFYTGSSKTDNFFIRKTTNEGEEVEEEQNNNFVSIPDCSIPRRILIQREKESTKPTSTNAPPTGDCGSCLAWGDPHITTWWSAKYNFFGTGDYTYVVPDTYTEDSYFRISGTLSAVKTASSNSKLTFEFRGETFEFSVPPSSNKVYSITVKFNGEAYTNQQSESMTVKKNKESEWTIALANGVKATITLNYWNINMLTLFVTIPATLTGNTKGLCGTCGDKKFTLPDGTTKTTLTASEAHEYGEQFSLSQTTPSASVTPTPYESHCKDDIKEFARKACLKVIDESDEQLLEMCMIDVCLTGHDGAAQGNIEKTGNENTDGVKNDNTDDRYCQISEVNDDNIYRFHQTSYATLDFVDPTSNDAGAQEGFLTPPDGWSLAGDSPQSRALASCASFGTTCLTYAEGTAVNKNLQKCGYTTESNLIVGKDSCWKPALPSSRILLKKEFHVDVDDNPVSVGDVAFVDADEDCPTLTKCHKCPNPMGAACIGEYTVPFNGKDEAFSVSIWSKAVMTGEVEVPTAKGYGLEIDVLYVDGTLVQNAAAQYFDRYSTKWNRRSVDFIPRGPVQTVKVRKYLKDFMDAEALFTGIEIKGGTKYGAGNILKDGECARADAFWLAYGLGATLSWEDNTGDDGSGAMNLLVPENTFEAGSWQEVYFGEGTDYPENPTGFYFRGDAKILEALGEGPGSGFSLYVDLYYTEEPHDYQIIAPFQKDVEGWQTAERTFLTKPGKIVSKIIFHVLLRQTTGMVVVDNLYLTPLYCPHVESTGDSSSYGDPHLVTLDGHPYDCQLVGDFILFQDPYLTIVTRHSRALLAAVNSMTGFYYNQTFFAFERNRDTAAPIFTIDNKVVDLLPGGSVNLPGGIGTIVASGSLSSVAKTIRYDIQLPRTNHQITLTAHVGEYKVQWLQVYPKVPLSSVNKTRGLLGVFNNDTSDDFTTSSGQVVNITSDELTTYKLFASTWKVESSGLKNKLTPDNDLVDEPIPNKVVGINDFPSNQIAAAQKACSRIVAYDSCVLDVLLTGDFGYVSGYNAMETIVKASVARGNEGSSSSSSSSNKNTIIIVLCVIGGLGLIGVVVGIVVFLKRRSVGRAT